MERSRRTYLSLALVGVLAAWTIAGCNAQGSDGEDASDTRKSISVSGFGEAAGTPDVASVDLGVETEAPDVAQAVEQSSETVEQVTQALIDAGIAETDIQSTRFNVWREEGFDRLTGQPTDEVTYHVDSTVRIKVRDIDQVSRMIQTGLDAGANIVFSLTFGIDDSSELEAEARLLALDDARDRAQQLADALGLKLGEPQVVSELVGSVPFGAVAESALVRGLGGGGGGPPLSPGELSVGVQVDVLYEVEG